MAKASFERHCNFARSSLRRLSGRAFGGGGDKSRSLVSNLLDGQRSNSWHNLSSADYSPLCRSSPHQQRECIDEDDEFDDDEKDAVHSQDLLLSSPSTSCSSTTSTTPHDPFGKMNLYECCAYVQRLHTGQSLFHRLITPLRSSSKRRPTSTAGFGRTSTVKHERLQNLTSTQPVNSKPIRVQLHRNGTLLLRKPKNGKVMLYVHLRYLPTDFILLGDDVRTKLFSSSSPTAATDLNFRKCLAVRHYCERQWFVVTFEQVWEYRQFVFALRSSGAVADRPKYMGLNDAASALLAQRVTYPFDDRKILQNQAETAVVSDDAAFRKRLGGRLWSSIRHIGSSPAKHY